MQYDLIVIGGGPGGYLAAERAAQKGLKTLLFEKRALGGVCLNEGCIPSKALLNSAKTYEHALHAADYGVTVTGVSIDQSKVVARKNKVVRTLVAGVKAKMRAHGVTVVMEEAVITGKTADGFTVSAAGTEYTGKNLKALHSRNIHCAYKIHAAERAHFVKGSLYKLRMFAHIL